MRYTTKSEQVKAYREGGLVERCHTTPHIGTYNVAIHSYNLVGMILVLHPSPGVPLIQAAMSHDLPERWTGDIPYPAKFSYAPLDKASKELEQFIKAYTGTLDHLNDEDKKWLKALDLAELFCWAVDQIHMGNQNVRQITEVIHELIYAEWIPQPVKDFVSEYSPERLNDFIYEGAAHELEAD